MIDYFEHTQIINLASREDRRRETIEEFRNNGFPINTDKVSFFEAIQPTEAQGFPNTGTRGCFLSHLKIIENAKNAGYQRILILEDDATFSKNIADIAPIAIEALDNMDWDLAYFGHSLEESDALEWRPLSQPMLLAHCYAINGKSLDKLCQFLHDILDRPAGHPDGGPMHYDGALNTFRAQNDDIQSFYFAKNLAYQRPSMTNIHDTSIYDKHPLLKVFTHLLRKAKRLHMKSKS